MEWGGKDIIHEIPSMSGESSQGKRGTWNAGELVRGEDLRQRGLMLIPGAGLLIRLSTGLALMVSRLWTVSDRGEGELRGE